MYWVGNEVLNHWWDGLVHHKLASDSWYTSHSRVRTFVTVGNIWNNIRRKLNSLCNLSLSSSFVIWCHCHLYFVSTGKFCCLINWLTSAFYLPINVTIFHKKADPARSSFNINCYLVLLLPSSIKLLLTSVNLAVNIWPFCAADKIFYNAVQLLVCSVWVLWNRNTVQVLHWVFKFNKLDTLVVLVFAWSYNAFVNWNVTSSISHLSWLRYQELNVLNAAAFWSAVAWLNM